MSFRMGGPGRCDKLQNILLGFLKPRGGRAQVSPELSKGQGGGGGGVRDEGKMMMVPGTGPQAVRIQETELSPGSRRMILAPS